MKYTIEFVSGEWHVKQDCPETSFRDQTIHISKTAKQAAQWLQEHFIFLEI